MALTRCSSQRLVAQLVQCFVFILPPFVIPSILFELDPLILRLVNTLILLHQMDGVVSGRQAVPELMDPFLNVSIFTRIDDLQKKG